MHILAAVLRCSSHPGLALGLFSAMKGMEGSCCFNLLRCLCSVPLETEVSTRRAGLGSWLSCPSPPCPSMSVLLLGASRSSCPMVSGYKATWVRISWGWDISARVGVVFSSPPELFSIPAGAKPRAEVQSPAPSSHRGLPLWQRGQRGVFAFNFFFNDAWDYYFFLVLT